MQAALHRPHVHGVIFVLHLSTLISKILAMPAIRVASIQQCRFVLQALISHWSDRPLLKAARYAVGSSATSPTWDTTVQALEPQSRHLVQQGSFVTLVFLYHLHAVVVLTDRKQVASAISLVHCALLHIFAAVARSILYLVLEVDIVRQALRTQQFALAVSSAPPTHRTLIPAHRVIIVQ